MLSKEDKNIHDNLWKIVEDAETPQSVRVQALNSLMKLQESNKEAPSDQLSTAAKELHFTIKPVSVVKPQDGG